MFIFLYDRHIFNNSVNMNKAWQTKLANDSKTLHSALVSLKGLKTKINKCKDGRYIGFVNAFPPIEVNDIEDHTPYIKGFLNRFGYGFAHIPSNTEHVEKEDIDKCGVRFKKLYTYFLNVVHGVSQSDIPEYNTRLAKFIAAKHLFDEAYDHPNERFTQFNCQSIANYYENEVLKVTRFDINDPQDVNLDFDETKQDDETDVDVGNRLLNAVNKGGYSLRAADEMTPIYDRNMDNTHGSGQRLKLSGNHNFVANDDGTVTNTNDIADKILNNELMNVVNAKKKEEEHDNPDFNDNEMSKLNINVQNAVRDDTSEMKAEVPKAETPSGESVNVQLDESEIAKIEKDPQSLQEHMDQLHPNKDGHVVIKEQPPGFPLDMNREHTTQDEKDMIEDEDAKAIDGQASLIDTAISMYYGKVGKYLKKSYNIDEEQSNDNANEMSEDEWIQYCLNAGVPQSNMSFIKAAYSKFHENDKSVVNEVSENVVNEIMDCIFNESTRITQERTQELLDSLDKSVMIQQKLLDKTISQTSEKKKVRQELEVDAVKMDGSISGAVKSPELQAILDKIEPGTNKLKQCPHTFNELEYREYIKMMKKGSMSKTQMNKYTDVYLYDMSKNPQMANRLKTDIKYAIVQLVGKDIRKNINYQKPLPAEYVTKFLQDLKQIRNTNKVLDDVLNELQSDYNYGFDPENISTYNDVARIYSENDKTGMKFGVKPDFDKIILSTFAKRTPEEMSECKKLADDIVNEMMYQYFEKYKYFKLFNVNPKSYSLGTIFSNVNRGGSKLILSSDKPDKANSIYSPNKNRFVTGNSDGVISDNISVLNKLKGRSDQLERRISKLSIGQQQELRQQQQMQLSMDEAYDNHYMDFNNVYRDEADFRNPQNIQIRNLNGELSLAADMNAIKNIMKGKLRF